MVPLLGLIERETKGKPPLLCFYDCWKGTFKLRDPVLDVQRVSHRVSTKMWVVPPPYSRLDSRIWLDLLQTGHQKGGYVCVKKKELQWFQPTSPKSIWEDPSHHVSLPNLKENRCVCLQVITEMDSFLSLLCSFNQPKVDPNPFVSV